LIRILEAYGGEFCGGAGSRLRLWSDIQSLSKRRAILLKMKSDRTMCTEAL
jgi:hypothetical protein